jgi:hypothetical protein
MVLIYGADSRLLRLQVSSRLLRTSVIQYHSSKDPYPRAAVHPKVPPQLVVTLYFTWDREDLPLTFPAKICTIV